MTLRRAVALVIVIVTAIVASHRIRASYRIRASASIQTDRSDGLWPGFRYSPWFREQVREERIEPGVRIVFNAPGPQQTDPRRTTLLVVYALPNGNSIEETTGCQMGEGTHWRFDIQHIAAQTRRLREIGQSQNVVVAYVEADGKSWPAWRKRHADSDALIRKICEKASSIVPMDVTRMALVAHSGGGSLIWGFLNAYPAIPDSIERIVFLDANYSFDEGKHHGDKLLAWLDGNSARHLVVLAYDDRQITLNGKLVVGPQGGTFRATHRMIDRIRESTTLIEVKGPRFDTFSGLEGRAHLAIHRNPDNRILHTRLVGEMNGYLHALTLGTPLEQEWGTFGGPRAYAPWIQPTARAIRREALDSSAQPKISPRLEGAPGGREFMEGLQALPHADRAEAIRRELVRGNLPNFLRRFVNIEVRMVEFNGTSHTANLQVMPDYLSVGNDNDFVRVPMTPQTAQAIADQFECVLPTRKIVDDIYQVAQSALEPQPLTEARESVATFVHHHDLIERQRIERQRGDLGLGKLVAGIKKDVVVTNRLLERPDRVAIFGWHRTNGVPIQPLSTVHRAAYVDYSHGVRLVGRRVIVDGQAVKLDELFKDDTRFGLVSDEGVILRSSY